MGLLGEGWGPQVSPILTTKSKLASRAGQQVSQPVQPRAQGLPYNDDINPSNRARHEENEDYQGTSNNDTKLENIEINLDRLEKALGQMSNKVSPGPDGAPTPCLKKGGITMKEYMVKMFRISVDDTDVPIEMREALICPIFKGGESSKCSNYRPIALTGHISKALERIIRPQMVEFLESNGLMDVDQHGCRPGRSTLTQLLAQHDLILDLLLEGANGDIIYLDFEKAFDRVDLGILLTRLKFLGITGKLGAWIGSFIMKRRQAVRVGGAISKWEEVKSGVPQGSVVGALLFLLFIGDLGENISTQEAKVLKYVDDTKVIKGVRTKEDVEDLQKTMDKVYSWQVQNMSFNCGKFQMLRIGKNEELKNETLLFTNDMGEIIESKDIVKDLGILVGADGTFKEQREAAILKTKRKANWVLRTFITKKTRCNDEIVEEPGPTTYRLL